MSCARLAAPLARSKRPASGAVVTDGTGEDTARVNPPLASVKQSWRCDICKIRRFPTFEEACAHEETCALLDAQPIEIADPEPDEVEIVEPPKQRKGSNQGGAKMRSTSPVPPKPKPFQVTSGNTRSTRDTAKPRSKASSSVHSFFASTSPKPSSSTGVKASSNHSAATKASGKQSRRRCATPPSSQSSWSDNVIDLDEHDKVVEEQRVLLQFMEQRRHQAQVERDKRDRQRVRRPNGNGASADEAIAVDNDADRTTVAAVVARSARGKSSTLPLAPLFPTTSHVISGTNDTSPTLRDEESSPCWKPVRRHATAMDVSTERLDALVPLFPAKASPCERAKYWEGGDDSNVMIQTLLTQCFCPSSTNKPRQDATLWVDRYNGHARQTTGASLQAAHDHLHMFIKRFMVNRQKAEALMAQRQEERKQQKKRKRPKTSRYDDGDFMDSEDEADLAEQNSSLCLITGPVGSGKSQLVHSVAQELGCRTVVELHTGKPRGAAAVKRHIEEATKSHSTFDMMQNKKPKTVMNTWFQKPSRHDLCNSDSDVDEDEAVNDEPSSAVTVILIDEVDNLFEGDYSIWMALGELYKHSKSPIVLTANTFPKALDTSTFSFQHIALEPPTISECAVQLQEILASERIVLRDGVNDTIATASLERIAHVGRCDMRRLIHEIQSFALLPPHIRIDQTDKTDTMLMIESDSDPKVSLASQSQLCRPEIESVRPLAIHANEFSLLTITGSNFYSLTGEPVDGLYECHVSIGRQRCPRACILNDTTIVAVVAPVHIPTELTNTMRAGRIASHSASYARITICSSNRLGIVSTSDAVTDRRDHLEPIKHTIIEYHFSNIRRAQDNGDESNSENEFDDNTIQQPRRLPILSRTVVLSAKDEETATKLLREGVAAWKSVHGDGPIFSTCQANLSDADDLCRVENMYHTANLASDCALFEDVGLSGLPYLAGSCNGFGFDLTDQFPKHTNEISKPPSEERLFASGWKDSAYFYGSSDSFMTRLIGARERKLLKWSESTVRGLVSLIPLSDGMIEEDGDEFRLSSDVSDETMFLPCQIPTCLFTIPSLLQMACSTSHSVGKELVYESKKATKIATTFGILHNYIFPRQCQARMRLHTMVRCIDPLVRGRLTVLDRQFFLDYLPFLRCMAVAEENAEAVFRALEDADAAEAAANRKTSSRTRGSRRRGRDHYFKDVIPHFVRESDDTPKEVGAILATSWLEPQ